MGASVQFYGFDQVMAAAKARNCSCWGIYINRALFSKYEDVNMPASLDILSQNLDVLEESGTQGIYTLKFFECDNKPMKITERSICDGGQFNFKMIEQDERIGNQIVYRQQMSHNSALEERIKKLEKELQESEIVDDEPETLEGTVIGLLKKPQDLAILANVFRGIIGLPVQNLGAITGIPAQSQAQLTEDEKLDRLEKAMDTLTTKDSNLLTHLEKLAALSEKEPERFKMMLGMLDIQQL